MNTNTNNNQNGFIFNSSQPIYGNSSQPIYGNSSQPIYGNSSQPIYGNSHTNLWKYNFIDSISPIIGNKFDYNIEKNNLKRFNKYGRLQTFFR
jgi:hypothetical protein